MTKTQEELSDILIDRMGNTNTNLITVMLLLKTEDQQLEMIDWLINNDSNDDEVIMDQVDRILGNKK